MIYKFKKKIILICIILFSLTSISPEIKLNNFLEKNNSPLLNDLFTMNIGIMKFKGIGNLREINPLDSQNMVNAIKNVLEKVPAVRLSRKEAVIKAIDIYASKLKENEKDPILFLKTKLFYSDLMTDSNLMYEFFLKLKDNTDYSPIAKAWYENIENPFYILNISEPFDRIVLNEENVCLRTKTSNNTPLDYLISGEIEKIDKLYFITIYVYSNLLKRRINEIYYVTGSQNITKSTSENFSRIIPNIFSIKYASLSIITKDSQTMIYLDSDYLGKQTAFVDFVIPGSYIITLKKENYEDKIENVILDNYEEKKVELDIAYEKELQIIEFYIEPLGTKIYINSLFQGRSPFKKALAKGTYVITAKNELYESYRYILDIKEVKKEEQSLIFHLKTKDPYDYLKLKKNLYYASFWNFTFSLAAAVPLIVFAYEYWNKAGLYYQLPSKINSTYAKLSLTRDVLYGFAAAMLSYSVLSAAWLFYALADYLRVLEKKDFIPIIEYYHKAEGSDEIKIGLIMKL